MPHDEEQPEPGRRGWSTALALGPALLLTPLLSVWASFLVPLRVGGWPVPLWLVPLVVMLVLAVHTGRRAGPVGTVVPALLWVAVSWLAAGARRAEGDLVVPATASGQLYLFGGALLWLAVVVRTPASSRPAASPGDPARR